MKAPPHSMPATNEVTCNAKNLECQTPLYPSSICPSSIIFLFQGHPTAHALAAWWRGPLIQPASPCWSDDQKGVGIHKPHGLALLSVF